MKVDRRAFVGGGLALGASACIPTDQSTLGRLASKLRIIEAAAGGTLGAEIHDTGTGMGFGLNRHMRFGHCSSFKMSLAAMALARDASGLVSKDRQVTWTEDDLMAVSPFTTERLAEGATISELAEATQKFSDNAAANILLREFGGPQELTGFWRFLGDTVSRLDRIEPLVNNVPEGEIQDTTTPFAMARTVARITQGQVLPDTHRGLLTQWMVDTRTGLRRVRSGLPEGWLAGDKTGTSLWPGMDSLYVDIGFVEPPNRAPLAFAAYYRARGTHDRIEPAAEQVLARVGGVIADYVAVARTLPI
ncbi:class A beta-lactamase [Erythrobacter sp. THAF29]|uniref:class A beta-lactamase n=1 Tax=Erythrobacter sp. THAF29 TaxID=2587851 RepID=UPI00126788BC|nr:class A beta-lactamase [Erythrobacter sp. THAF29]QFT78915.1 Carbepenem-hydrolyzing beta-lactamase KPC precursor [Erythrobacter sp. THAF29]